MTKWLFLLLFATSAQAGEWNVPNDFATIPAAIEAAEVGDIILLQPGIYQGPLLIPEGITLRSVGKDQAGQTGLTRAESTQIDSGGKSPAVILKEGAILDGLTITGAGHFDSEEFQKHHATRGENLPDERGAVGTGQERPAVEIEGVSATVINCIVRDNGHAGIGVSGNENHSQILDNFVFRNMGGGIGIANGAAPRIADNHCYENLRGGIGCRNSYPLIEDNHCFRNVRAGIGIREGATPLVRRNRCYENRRAGIGVRMPGTSPFVTENECFENGMAGIGCRDGASPVIQGNQLVANRLAGVGAMSDAHPVIVGNEISGNDAAAIGLAACEKGTALIYGNRIQAKSLVALGINEGWTVTVEENQILREKGMPPLAMVFAGARADFYRNTFTGNGIAAIRNAGRVFLAGNTFICPVERAEKQQRQALWTLEGASSSMTDDNRFTHWKKPNLPSRRVSSDQELREALTNAKPGDTILIASGDYSGGLHLDTLQGTAQSPIIVSGSDSLAPPLFTGGNSGMHLVRPEHLELRHLSIRRAKHNGLNIDDGGNFETPAQFLSLKHLEISEVGADGNQDGIKLSGVRHFRVENCRIEKWGERGSGIDHVGCSDGVISDSTLIHETGPMGSGIQAKGGSHDLRILRNRFIHTGGRSVNLGGSTGLPYFRPPNAEFEAQNLTVVDCHFSGSTSPIAFVGVDKALVRNCTIENPGRWVVRILQESTQARFLPCRNGRFERNLIQYDPSQIFTRVNIGSNTEPDSFVFRGNSWKSSSSSPQSNLPLEEIDEDHGDAPTEPGYPGHRWIRPLEQK